MSARRKARNRSNRINAIEPGGRLGCETGKVGFPSKKSAKRRVGGGLKGRRFYRCAYCDLWHSTTMTYAEQVRSGLVRDEGPARLVSPTEQTGDQDSAEKT